MKKYKLFQKNISIAFFPFLILSQMGCSGDYRLESSNTVEKKEVVRSMDAIKLIHQDIENPQDIQTYSQDVYPLNQKSRLLMKYESFEQDLLKDKSSGSVILRVSLANTQQRDLALSSLKVCALKTNWMMMATWKKAHPFHGGDWSAGSDFDPMTCSVPKLISAPSATAKTEASFSVSAPEPEKTLFQSCQLKMHLCFDVTDWFQNYVSDQGRNAGLVLISSAEGMVQIFGEMGAYGPRLHWLTDIEKQSWKWVPVVPPPTSEDQDPEKGGNSESPSKDKKDTSPKTSAFSRSK
jgi:hypothetical protein